MYWLRRRLLSQNFLVNRKLVRKLIRGSSISPSDTVLEIGSGTGIITQELLQTTKKVIAIEQDVVLYSQLKQKFAGNSNLFLYQGDFLNFNLPKYPYKVFSNIPFSITGAIVRKLLGNPTPPTDCYLIMQSQAAAKFIIQPTANTLAAILYYPFWDIQITYRFARTDFSPIPAVDSVLVRFSPRCLITNKSAYQDFIAYSFTHNKLAKFIPPAQWLKLFTRHNPKISRGAFAHLSHLQSLLPPHPSK